ncbi:MAG: RdgB/HAM1 family non-canonical purine NTP pyrophosphatase [Kordiimonadaceae bacterium]|jgi:XTP/dITP diphosphohydrolase|nr:RdgB/HAM1 family non-canonical purine NTP pyrophosphatase [Kordiimonadaceae bacterium]MBT6033706.1 RdgB/HAM1 family non-canonical purine NTP pyrophosphatase [Kordiimonadaceae bacterium]
MTRRFNEKKLVVASHNKGKVREISELLAPYGVDVYSSAELSLSEPIEDGETFIANAEIKSKSATAESGLVSLADDSGLVVPSLGGIPGIHSARYAVNPETNERDFPYGMKRLNDELGNKERAAYFACALSLAWPDGHVETFEGQVHGELVWPLMGENGFGYDPMFRANGLSQTFGEMPAAEKHAISHRANAFKKLIDACFKN